MIFENVWVYIFCSIQAYTSYEKLVLMLMWIIFKKNDTHIRHLTKYQIVIYNIILKYWKKYGYLILIFDCKLMTENTGTVYVQCILTKVEKSK